MLIERIRAHRFKEGPGVTEPVPKTGFRRFFFLLATHPWKLIGLNLLFVLFSLPLVTLPAALCGMNRVCIRLVREGVTSVFSDFFEEFKSSLFKSLLFGVLFGAMLLDSCIFLNISRGVATPAASSVFLGIALFLFFAADLLAQYCFVLCAMLPLKNRDIFKNAVCLIALEKRASLFSLAVTLSMQAALVLFFPYTLPILLFIGPAVLQLAVCTAINAPTQKHIIEPYEQQRKSPVSP